MMLMLVFMLPGCSEEASETEAEASSSDIEVEDAMGAKRVPADAERVVALEWVYAEMLLTLGVQPVGMADLEVYRDWVAAGPAPAESVQPVGGRQEPSLESIAQLEPDLIVGLQYRTEPVYDRFAALAPTLLFAPYAPGEGRGQLEGMRRDFRRIGRAVGRVDEVEQVLNELDATLATGREQLADLPASERRFILVQAFTQENAPIMRVFTDDAMAVQLLEAVGLENAWEGQGQRYGFATVGLDALTQLGDVHLLYVAQVDDDAFEQDYREHPVWQELPFVQSGKVHALGGDVWFFGGPRSGQMLVERAVAAVGGQGGGALAVEWGGEGPE